jgi:molecular chaperone DnaJ
MAGKDYYYLLGIPREADEKEVKRAFRLLARKYHPDVNPGSNTAEARFKEINEAYEVLSDPEKRRKYDKYGDQWQHADEIEKAKQQGAQYRQWGGRGGAEYVDNGAEEDENLGSIFDNLFRGFNQQGQGAPQFARPRNVQNTIEVTLEEAYAGASRTIQLRTEEVCPTCGGSGQGNRGTSCPTCRGAGRISRIKRLEVKIPAGVKDGSKIRLAGEGATGRGGVRGDLYLVVKLLPHKIYERKEDDLYMDVSVPLTTAVLGGEVPIPLLKGRLALKIPPETQNGNVFRLTGKGMPHLGDGAFGDMFARIKVILPSRLTVKEKQLFEQLKELRPSQAG